MLRTQTRRDTGRSASTFARRWIKWRIHIDPHPSTDSQGVPRSGEYADRRVRNDDLRGPAVHEVRELLRPIVDMVDPVEQEEVMRLLAGRHLEGGDDSRQTVVAQRRSREVVIQDVAPRNPLSQFVRELEQQPALPDAARTREDDGAPDSGIEERGRGEIQLGPLIARGQASDGLRGSEDCVANTAAEHLENIRGACAPWRKRYFPLVGRVGGGRLGLGV